MGRPSGSSELSADNARNAPTVWAHITLCPQPCPMPGRASYSQVNANTGASGSEFPMLARSAVGISKTPFLLLMPCRASTSATVFIAKYSLKPVSGCE